MNSKKNTVIVTGIFWLLGIVGLFYAASRTLHFVETTMPSGDKLNGYLYLFFTGGGAFLWAQVYLKHAIGATRRATAFMLAIGDLLAEMILVYADTQYVANANGLLQMSQDELKIFITATVGVVAINLVGWFIYHLNDPEHRKASMAQDLADEVEETTYKQLNTPAERQALINNLMPTYGASIIAEVTRSIHERAGYAPVAGTPFEKPFEKKEAIAPAVTIPHPIATPSEKDEPVTAQNPLSYHSPANTAQSLLKSVTAAVAKPSAPASQTNSPRTTPTASASLEIKTCSYCGRQQEATLQQFGDGGWLWKYTEEHGTITICDACNHESSEQLKSYLSA